MIDRHDARAVGDRPRRAAPAVQGGDALGDVGAARADDAHEGEPLGEGGGRGRAPAICARRPTTARRGARRHRRRPDDRAAADGSRHVGRRTAPTALRAAQRRTGRIARPRLRQPRSRRDKASVPTCTPAGAAPCWRTTSRSTSSRRAPARREPAAALRREPTDLAGGSSGTGIAVEVALEPAGAPPSPGRSPRR